MDFRTILIVIISCLIRWGNADEDNGTIDYAKLTLNTKELLGSRWAIQKHDKVVVFHAFQIVDLVKVDVNDMSIRIDFHIRQRWQAGGLDFPKGLFKADDKPDIFISADENVLQSVWSPDSFIPNARETKILAMAASHSAVNIYKNKTIIYKARMFAVLGCSFRFEWYPLDIQTCDLPIESYKYSNEHVMYEWEPGNPVTALDGILLYQYDFFLPPDLRLGTQKRWAGRSEYPYVKMIFKFERKLGNNIIQIFTPTVLVVVLSFFSFWLGLDAVPGRISLLVTCILTLVTMHSGLKGVIPPVHYIKMMDIWMIGCMVFVFGAICEFIIVKYLKWRAMQIKAAKDEQEAYMKKNFPNAPAPAFHINNASKVMSLPMPNTVYPEFGQYASLQNNRNLNQNQILSNSAHKRQAWENVQLHALRAHPELNIPRHVPGEYPGMVNMPPPGMSIYNNQLIPPPPSTTRPIWVKIDRVCRILFPLLFAIFNAAYWPILLIGAADQLNNR